MSALITKSKLVLNFCSLKWCLYQKICVLCTLQTVLQVQVNLHTGLPLTSFFLLLPKVTFSDYELIVTIQKGKNLQTNCEHAVFFYFNIMSKDVETFQFYPLILNSKHEA